MMTTLLLLCSLSFAFCCFTLVGAVSNCTLGSAIAAGGCETVVAAGMSAQIAAQLRANGFTFPIITGYPNIQLGPSCQPFLQQVVLDALIKATNFQNQVISLDSAFRSAAQQYMLYRWYQQGKCGIQIAALPGTSNHEGGAAIDVNDHATWQAALTAVGFQWYGADDVVHFDYRGPGVQDLRSQNLRAFQQLWNQHHPNHQPPLAENGVFDAQTAAALESSPCDGFSS